MQEDNRFITSTKNITDAEIENKIKNGYPPIIAIGINNIIITIALITLFFITNYTTIIHSITNIFYQILNLLSIMLVIIY